ncbi:hypothetical protein [Dickeya parazeae]|uniref:hypothetical protein n=1 Tax=Dickeya parazeae TaxID=2893572 RepID=UPI001AECDA65|nr:hypothetical protein [Dickeya parazeae]MBP2834510.1 hypothetical protein [Dickeya parazeae]
MNRILLTTFPGAFMHYGGGEREIHLLNEALNGSGMLCDIYGPTSRSITSYQAVIHFSMASGSEQVIASAVEHGLRLILWPNLWFVDPPSPDSIEKLNALLDYFHAVVFRSQAEENHFRQYLDLSNKDVIRVYPLISPKFFRKNVTDVFRESYGLDFYAIWPGIIEPQKNQLAAVRAFNGLNLALIISGAVRDKYYADECKRQAGANIKFIPAMPFGSEQHLSALAHSQMVIELPLDFPGTSAIEAAAMGTKLLLPRSSWADEMLGPYCTQVDPCNEDEIRNAIEFSLCQKSKTTVPRTDFLNMFNAVSPLVNYINLI